MMAYVEAVTSGRILASERTRQAMRRHLADLEKSRGPDFPYVFDAERAGKAIRFCELFKHVKGDIVGQPLRLHEWALFFVASIFGWRVKGSGARRFRKALAWLPRGNTKSTVLSACSNYAAFAESQQADAFSLATTKEQAGICWGDAAAMWRASPEIRDRLGIEVLATAIVQVASNSSFKRLASRDTNLDGLNVSWAVIDELHEIPRSLWDVIETALGKRANSILVSISTAGMDSGSFGREMYLYCCQVLAGEIPDEQTFALVYEAPEGADHYAEETMIAANPMWGLSVRPEIVKAAAEKARRFAGHRAAYLVKHLNVWASARDAWFDIQKWDEGADRKLKPEDFAADPCFLGMDLASRKAFACVAKVFVRDLPHRDPDRAEAGETERHWYVFVDSYLNEASAAAAASDSVRSWVLDGYVIETPGNTTDYGFIRRDIEKALDTLSVQAIVTDPYEAGQFTELGGRAPLVEWPQRVQYLSPPMKEMSAAVIDGRLHHPGNPVMRFFVSNTQAKMDANENVFPRKEREEAFIDGVSAALNAIGHAMTQDAAIPYSATRGLLTL
jgi:phage terminase large subunit-like protein